MRTHRFVGATSREVLHKVKQALGEDALILSNRPYNGAIEVVALSAADLNIETDGSVTVKTPIAVQPSSARVMAAPVATQAPAAPVVTQAPAAPVVAPAPPAAMVAVATPLMATTSAVTAWTPSGIAQSIPPQSIPLMAATAVTRSTVSPPVFSAPLTIAQAPTVFSAPVMAATQNAATLQGAPSQAQTGLMQGGARSVADYTTATPVESPRKVAVAQIEHHDPKRVLKRNIVAMHGRGRDEMAVGKAGVMHELLNAGFSARLSRQVAEEVCAGDIDPTIEDIAECMERELWLAGADEIISCGGVYALVGPTGVGKTTTVAKLAARAVVRFGASKVALLTTDSYRIGAHDQLRIFGRILSVSVHAIRDAHDLSTALEELKDRHLILIDTIGVSQRDRMVAEHAAMLAGAGDVKRLLLVNTTANARTLEEVVVAYKKSGVDGCILTKTDEAASLAPALDVLIRHQLPLHYVTDGQRVPEDLKLPDSTALVQEALKPAPEDALDLGAQEMLFMQPDTRTSTLEVAHG
ncbi:MAG TPA: flagellar biosynthesis protein FlhF [Burkholderiales bacterium]|nr:flagellar biosynthesis protein FlhF [Burkholderiales bacterium]